MTKVVVNIELLAFLQNVVGGPSWVNLPAKNRYEVAAASNLADGDDRSVPVVLAARTGCLVHPVFGIWHSEQFEPLGVGKWFRECSVFRREVENDPHLRNTEVSKEVQLRCARRGMEITSA